jgi:hypothetical protein
VGLELGLEQDIDNKTQVRLDEPKQGGSRERPKVLYTRQHLVARAGTSNTRLNTAQDASSQIQD